MYLIKPCPNCRTKIRFPIDKGTLRVTCSCGYTFVANPDNTDIYQNATFDLRSVKNKFKMMDSFKKAFSGVRFSRIKNSIIIHLLDGKYKIQNFRLLPDSERKKIILTLVFICAGIFVLIAAICAIVQISGAGSKIII